MQRQVLLDKKNPEKTKKIPLKFIAYTFGYSKKLNISNQLQFLENAKKLGF